MLLKNKCVLVSGGAGFIGSHIVDRVIADAPEKVVIIDDFSIGKDRNIGPAKESFERLRVYKCDASDYKAFKNVLESERVDVVFNAAVIPLPASLVEPEKVYGVNVAIVKVACELLRRGSYETLIQISSSEVYGDLLYSPMDEKHPLNPTTPYAASKSAGDHLVLSYHRTFGLDVAIARPFNNYGPRQNDGTYAAVIPVTIKRILRGEPPVIYGDGDQTRDYTYVTDTANAIVEIHGSKAARGKVVNIASGEETKIKEVISKIAAHLGYKGEILYDKPRAGDVRRYIGDSSLAKEIIGYSPKIGLEEGLRRTVEWYRNLHDQKA